jgi:hypothetical protein
MSGLTLTKSPTVEQDAISLAGAVVLRATSNLPRRSFDRITADRNASRNGIRQSVEISLDEAEVFQQSTAERVAI